MLESAWTDIPESLSVSPSTFETMLKDFFEIHQMPSDGNCCAYALAKAKYPILLDINDSSQNDEMLRDYGRNCRKNS